MLLISFEILDRSASNTALHGRFSDGSTHLSNQSWVDRFWDKVLRTKGKVVYMINLIHHVWYGFFSQVSNSLYCCHLHFLVDSFGMNIQGTTEYVWETNYVINLIRVVRTASRHDYVRSGSNSVVVRYLRNRISQCKHNRILVH